MKKLLPIVILSIVFASCHHSSGNRKDDLSTMDLELPQDKQLSTLPQKSEQREMKEGLLSDSTVSAKPPQANLSNEDWDKKIIKTAFLTVEVKNFTTYAEAVHKVARQYGGYVANEAQSESGNKIETTISIKVPVDQFESIMHDLPAGATKVIEKKITSEDVTGEEVDIKSRLEAKRQMRLKYLEFLRQSKNMTEVLQVQAEINSIQEEIESASGRINYLSHQSAYSTVNITFYQPLAGFDPVENSPGFLKSIVKAFGEGTGFIIEMIIGITSIWPVFLLAIIAWVFWKRRVIIVAPSKQKL